MTWVQVIVLSVLQGIAELFPVSSLGHTVIIPGVLGWGDLLRHDAFLPFVVLLHVATAAALFTFFWRDWFALIKAVGVTSVKGRIDADPNGRLAWVIIAGTIPTGLIGLFLQDTLRGLFAQPKTCAIF